VKAEAAAEKAEKAAEAEREEKAKQAKALAEEGSENAPDAPAGNYKESCRGCAVTSGLLKCTHCTKPDGTKVRRGARCDVLFCDVCGVAASLCCAQCAMRQRWCVLQDKS
jgi:hypothetical protein